MHNITLAMEQQKQQITTLTMHSLLYIMVLQTPKTSWQREES